MKKSNIKWQLVTLLTSMAILISIGNIAIGCKTVTSNTGQQAIIFDPVAAQATASSLAEIGVYLGIQQDPSLKPVFKLAAVAINNLAVNGKFNPAEVEQAINGLAADDLKKPYVAIGLRSALILYKNAFSTAVAQKLDQPAALKPILLAIANGITSGIGGANVELKYNLPPRTR